MEAAYHVPVLVDAVLQYLLREPEGIYVDGTLGGGGHAEYMLNALSPSGKVIGFDCDHEALQFAQIRLKRFGDRVQFVHDNVANLVQGLSSVGITNVDGILLDLGVSSHQIDTGTRGFSFQSEGHLDMRMNAEQRLDGWTVVNTYDRDTLADIIWKYGEERTSRRIAREIVAARVQHPIDSTRQLAEIVEKTAGKKFLQKTLARVFQAIRIEVNNEMDNLQRALSSAIDILHPHGRIVVISYHSLEDRMTKDFFRNEARDVIRSENEFLPDIHRNPRLHVLTKKPLEASPEETLHNPRARSAKLRAAEKV